MIKLCVMCEKCSFNEGYFLSEYTHEDPNISCMLNLHNNEAPLKGVYSFINGTHMHNNVMNLHYLKN